METSSSSVSTSEGSGAPAGIHSHVVPVSACPVESRRVRLYLVGLNPLRSEAGPVTTRTEGIQSMRPYEVVYIFHPALSEDAVNEKLEKYHALVTGDEGAEVTATDHWGPRQLAYEIKGQNQGFFVVVQFTGTASSLGPFERILKLDEELLRYLIVLSEGEPTSGMSVLAESPYTRSDDDDDDDEEEEEEEDFGHGEASPPEFSGGRGRRRRMDGPRIELLNFKDVGTLSRFVTEQGKILPKRTTKVTSQFQRHLGRAVKRARYLALLPYVQKHDR